MTEKSILPEDFDGVFRFTNWTDRDFEAKWGGIKYKFPANTTSPMIISGESPEGVQNIRKKFAKELAVREYYETDKFKSMNSVKPSGGSNLVGATYTDNDLAGFVQKCLEPLQPGRATAQLSPKVDESVFKKDDEGKPITQVLDKNKSLIGDGTIIA